MSLRTRDYDYQLPDELIACTPLPGRADARMMVLHRATEEIEHRRFAEFPEFVQPGDLLVLNDTKVQPARAFSDDGKLELLFLESKSATTWKCLVKPGKKMRIGDQIIVGKNPGLVREIFADGERLIEFASAVDLEAIGEMPIPPYLRRRGTALDLERYQTVFARNPGAVAAPTAGLHFTREMLDKLPHTFVTLHVGVGTFKPVQVESVPDHPMHAENYSVDETAASALAACQRVIAIGTTSVRVLESCADADGQISAGAGSTQIFIHPPYQFKIVDALLTNFHLPKSTLLMLVSAFAGRGFALRAYAEAIAARYRFFSYGDCMLIL
jgi:S-adenosylmethionine:tRNA ribosyltransferase-isomerase